MSEVSVLMPGDTILVETSTRPTEIVVSESPAVVEVTDIPQQVEVVVTEVVSVIDIHGGVYFHRQRLPATVWVIRHDLGYDPGGILVITDEGYVAQDWGLQYLEQGISLRLSFDIAISGTATLS